MVMTGPEGRDVPAPLLRSCKSPADHVLSRPIPLTPGNGSEFCDAWRAAVELGSCAFEPAFQSEAVKCTLHLPRAVVGTKPSK